MLSLIVKISLVYEKQQPEAMKIREREIWIEDGPSPQELFDGHKYNDNPVILSLETV